MSISLYDISAEYANALSVLNDMDLDEQTIKDSLANIEGDFKDKCEAVAQFRANQIIVADAKKALADKLMAQVRSMNNRASEMLDYLDQSMQRVGVDKLECDYFTIKYAKNPDSVKVTNAELIPSEYKNVKTTESVDKAALKKQLQSGLSCKGAELITDSKRLVIK